MATIKWLGGATAVAQVSTVTLNNDFNDSETALSITLTAEDGSTTQSVSITPSGTNETTIAAALQVACAASSQSLFQAITFTAASNVVTLTANTAGVPFYFASAVTGGAGTTTDATGTSNAGPNDWNTAANWSTNAVPTNSDSVVIADGDFDILYGLDQSSVSLANLSVNVGFTGNVGDIGNEYPLQINGNVANIRASGRFLWSGDLPVWIISQTARGSDAVVLKDTTGLAVYILGVNCIGEVRIQNGSGAPTVTMTECPRAQCTIEDGVSGGTLFLGSGTVVSESDINNVTIWGGTLTMNDSGIYGTLEQLGGVINANGSPDSGNNGGEWFGSQPKVYGGLLTFAANTQTAVTIESGMQVYGGTVNFRSGLQNITFDVNPTVWGGQVLTDQGLAFDPTP